jgi:hypothetical protein
MWKVKLSLCLLPWTHLGGGGIAQFLTSVPISGEQLASRPCRFTPRELALGARCVEGWVGLSAGLDAVEEKETLHVARSNAGYPIRVPTLYRLIYSGCYWLIFRSFNEPDLIPRIVCCWRPPLWSSRQSSWLQIQRSGFDSRRYQMFWEVVGLERGPLSLVSAIEELLGRESSGFGLESREYGRREPSRWPRDTFYPQKLVLTSPTSGGRSVGIVRSRTQVTEEGKEIGMDG